MANVINRVTRQFLTSVHTIDFPSEEWILNPILPNCLPIYWKIVGDLVQEMSQAEKDIIDQQIADAQTLLIAKAKDFTTMFDKLLKAFALVVLDEINVLRTKAGLATRTVEQLKTAITSKYDTL